jgi:hypothetical protein
LDFETFYKKVDTFRKVMATQVWALLDIEGVLPPSVIAVIHWAVKEEIAKKGIFTSILPTFPEYGSYENMMIYLWTVFTCLFPNAGTTDLIIQMLHACLDAMNDEIEVLRSHFGLFGPPGSGKSYLHTLIKLFSIEGTYRNEAVRSRKAGTGQGDVFYEANVIVLKEEADKWMTTSANKLSADDVIQRNQIIQSMSQNRLDSDRMGDDNDTSFFSTGNVKLHKTSITFTNSNLAFKDPAWVDRTSISLVDNKLGYNDVTSAILASYKPANRKKKLNEKQVISQNKIHQFVSTVNYKLQTTKVCPKTDFSLLGIYVQIAIRAANTNNEQIQTRFTNKAEARYRADTHAYQAFMQCHSPISTSQVKYPTLDGKIGVKAKPFSIDQCVDSFIYSAPNEARALNAIVLSLKELADPIKMDVIEQILSIIGFMPLDLIATWVQTAGMMKRVESIYNSHRSQGTKGEIYPGVVSTTPGSRSFYDHPKVVKPLLQEEGDLMSNDSPPEAQFIGFADYSGRQKWSVLRKNCERAGIEMPQVPVLPARPLIINDIMEMEVAIQFYPVKTETGLDMVDPTYIKLHDIGFISTNEKEYNRNLKIAKQIANSIHSQYSDYYKKTGHHFTLRPKDMIVDTVLDLINSESMLFQLPLQIQTINSYQFAKLLLPDCLPIHRQLMPIIKNFESKWYIHIEAITMVNNRLVQSFLSEINTKHTRVRPLVFNIPSDLGVHIPKIHYMTKNTGRELQFPNPHLQTEEQEEIILGNQVLIPDDPERKSKTILITEDIEVHCCRTWAKTHFYNLKDVLPEEIDKRVDRAFTTPGYYLQFKEKRDARRDAYPKKLITDVATNTAPAVTNEPKTM